MSNLITRPIHPEALQQLADSVDKMKGQAFSLLKLLITGLQPAQNFTMKYFKELISVKGMVQWVVEHVLVGLELVISQHKLKYFQTFGSLSRD